MCFAWVRTVFSLMTRRSAMLAMLFPRAMSSMTSVSRDDSPYSSCSRRHCLDVRSRMAPASSEADGRLRRRFGAGLADAAAPPAPTADGKNSMGSTDVAPFDASGLNNVPVAASNVRPSTQLDTMATKNNHSRPSADTNSLVQPNRKPTLCMR